MNGGIVYTANRERNVELEDLEFLKSTLEGKHMDILWLGWVLLFTDGPEGQGQMPLRVSTVAGTSDPKLAHEDALDDGGDDEREAVMSNIFAEAQRTLLADGAAGVGVVDEDCDLPEKAKERILVLTNFRLLTIKNGKLGRSVRQSLHILDLQSMKSRFEGVLHMRFKGQRHLCVHHCRVPELARAVLWVWKSLTHGFSQELQPHLAIPRSFLQDVEFPAPDQADGMLATYMAMVDYFGLKQRLHVLDYLMSRFAQNDVTLELSDCFAASDGATPTATAGDLTALAIALKHARFFRRLISVDFTLRDEGLSIMASAITPQVEKLVLINTKAGKDGFRRIQDAVIAGGYNLVELDLSQNVIGDAVMSDIISALLCSRRALKALHLSNTGMTGKGFFALRRLLCQHTRVKTAAPGRFVSSSMVSTDDGDETAGQDVLSETWIEDLHVLDISENKGGIEGSNALAEWISFPLQYNRLLAKSKVAGQRALRIGLTELYVMKCDLNLAVFFNALASNTDFSIHGFRILDISENKLTANALPGFQRVLRSTESLKYVYANSVGLRANSFLDVFSAALSNRNVSDFKLDFSDNDLGTKLGKDLLLLYRRYNPNAASILRPVAPAFGTVHTLVLNGTGIGNAGVLAVCQALAGTSIVALSLERLVKNSVFSSPSAVSVAKAMATLIRTTPNLKELSVAGDDSYYFHCSTCDICLSVNLRNNHICREATFRSNCPVCSDFLFTSVKAVNMMRCGHPIHTRCLNQHLKASYACPLCKKSIYDMSSYFDSIDAHLHQSEMPPEFRDFVATVLCNDCEQYSKTPFHFLYMMCRATLKNSDPNTHTHGPDAAENDDNSDAPVFCRSYNTKLTSRERVAGGFSALNLPVIENTPRILASRRVRRLRGFDPTWHGRSEEEGKDEEQDDDNEEDDESKVEEESDEDEDEAAGEEEDLTARPLSSTVDASEGMNNEHTST